MADAPITDASQRRARPTAAADTSWDGEGMYGEFFRHHWADVDADVLQYLKFTKETDQILWSVGVTLDVREAMLNAADPPTLEKMHEFHHKQLVTLRMTINTIKVRVHRQQQSQLLVPRATTTATEATTTGDEGSCTVF